MDLNVCGALKLIFGSEKEKNYHSSAQTETLHEEAKCSNDLYFNRVEIRPAAKRMGRKFKTMEVKYVYKFVSSKSYFYISSFPFLQPSTNPLQKQTCCKELKITKKLSTP
jgi:hypothetical protein